ncbi:toxin-antitoxin system, toxin component, Txe/YoeB family [Cylindrospermum stagnale PCC 7417]|uniref:Endoribonuclease YoeB n=1 Tax=Cylindrospermum stagnale PCC 7417 TaxID=56107 RepID=K9WPW0_9NOST|nr:Txe/YoeB family addiction module toxin [Cylindrospermum stagnale]AFZ22430.1 toxin-antitoxin system, toxin component, Txe/YoeB family [Cylindrospermum stagnale PCC 7417]
MNQDTAALFAAVPDAGIKHSQEKVAPYAVCHPEFLEDLTYWVDTNRKTALHVFKLIEAIMRDPFTGIGKPEPLKYLDSNTWSRRLTKEHRIVYRVSDDRIDFLQARYHY